jgi:hypothetical protein
VFLRDRDRVGNGRHREPAGVAVEVLVFVEQYRHGAGDDAFDGQDQRVCGRMLSRVAKGFDQSLPAERE